MAEAFPSGFPNPKVDFGGFSVKSHEDPIAVLTEILTTLNTVASLIPPLNTCSETLGKFLTIINFFADKENLEEAMIDAKISDAMEKLVLGLFNSKIVVIKSQLDNILDKNVTEKGSHCVNALANCLELLQYFTNNKYPFWEDVIPSSGLLLNFATIYSRILILAQELYPNCIYDWDIRKEALKESLRTYKHKCVEERMKKVYIFCTETLVEGTMNPNLTFKEIRKLSKPETTKWFEKLPLYIPACYIIKDDYVKFQMAATEKYKQTRIKIFREFLTYYDSLKIIYESAFDIIIDNIFNSA